MTITAEELRKVYEDTFFVVGTSAYYTKQSMYEDRHPKALMAVARYVAEKQRAVEPTMQMLELGAEAYIEWNEEDDNTVLSDSVYRAMQSVAPLVVPE